MWLCPSGGPKLVLYGWFRRLFMCEVRPPNLQTWMNKQKCMYTMIQRIKCSNRLLLFCEANLRSCFLLSVLHSYAQRSERRSKLTKHQRRHFRRAPASQKNLNSLQTSMVWCRFLPQIVQKWATGECTWNQQRTGGLQKARSELSFLLWMWHRKSATAGPKDFVESSFSIPIPATIPPGKGPQNT